MKIKNIIKDNKGFTLIELLAVITILSVVMSIGIYVSFDVIKEAREKSYKVTKANIENNASSYVKENSNKVTYVNVVSDSAAEYQCVTVGDLVESGYLSQKVTDSKVSDDTKVSLDHYVYVERNKKTKSLTKSEYNGGAVGYCDIATNGDITFSVSPDNNKWSKSKTVTITYKVLNHTPGNTYNYTHTVINTATNTITSSGDNNSSPKAISITKPSSITAKIVINGKSDTESTINISKIDTVGPTIEFDSSIKGNYNESVKIPIKIEDTQSGLDKRTVEKEDFVITIGGVAPQQYTLKELTNNPNYNYELEIIDDVHSGDVVITVEKGKILDNVENENNLKKLENKFTMNMGYIITLNKNGATNTPTASVRAVYNSKVIDPSTITLPERKYNIGGWKLSSKRKSNGATVTVNGTTITDTYTLTANYTFLGWYKDNTKIINEKATPSFAKNVSGWTGSNGEWIRKSNETLSASYTEASVKLPKITKSSNTCGWTTDSSGTTIMYASEEIITPTSNMTLYGVCEEIVCSCPNGTVQSHATLGQICVTAASTSVSIEMGETFGVGEACVNDVMTNDFGMDSGCFDLSIGGLDGDNYLCTPGGHQPGVKPSEENYYAKCMDMLNGCVGGNNELSQALQNKCTAGNISVPKGVNGTTVCPQGFAFDTSIGKCYKKCGENSDEYTYSCPDGGTLEDNETLGHICRVPTTITYEGMGYSLHGFSAGCLTSNFGCSFPSGYSGFITTNTGSDAAEAAMAACANLVDMSTAGKVCGDILEIGASSGGTVTGYCPTTEGFIYNKSLDICYKVATRKKVS